MAYFDKFPQVRYSFDDGKINKTAINILKRVGFRDYLKDNTSYFIEYNVKDGDTPEMVAHKIYGSSDLHWVILLFNEIVNPFYDWPMSTRKLESFIKKRYPGSAFFLTDESGGTGTFADVHFDRNWTVLGVNGNTYDDLQSAVYGQTNAALVYKWDKSLSKLEVTDVSGDFAVGDFIVAIGTSADGSTYNVGAHLSRVVDLNYSAVHHFENTIDNTILNPLGAPPTGGTGEQVLVGRTAGAGAYSSSAVTYGDTVLQNYVTNVLLAVSETFAVTNYEHETKENEKFRTIRIIKPEHIQRIVSEFENLMRGG